jgi:hypothetical protein
VLYCVLAAGYGHVQPLNQAQLAEVLREHDYDSGKTAALQLLANQSGCLPEGAVLPRALFDYDSGRIAASRTFRSIPLDVSRR